jgi:hypothetical protein
MVFGQCAVVPADGAADRKGVAVDPTGGVVRGGNTNGLPIGQSAELAQAVRHGAHGSPGLALELAEVQFTDTARCPKVCWKPNLSNHLTARIEGEPFDRTCGEIKARDKGCGTEVTACHVIRLKNSMHGPVGCIRGIGPQHSQEKIGRWEACSYSTKVASP